MGAISIARLEYWRVITCLTQIWLIDKNETQFVNGTKLNSYHPRVSFQTDELGTSNVFFLLQSAKMETYFPQKREVHHHEALKICGIHLNMTYSSGP